MQRAAAQRPRITVLDEKDIWRAALLVQVGYGSMAEAESARRADELASAGDETGAAIWRTILWAVRQLADVEPPPGALN